MSSLANDESTFGERIIQNIYHGDIFSGNIYGSIVGGRGNINSFNNDPSQNAVDDLRQIATWLTARNFHPIQNDTFAKHTIGTGSWFFNSEEFKDWVAKDTATLWVTGMPGVGKTILSSIIIDHLQKGCSADQHVLFVYCRYADPLSVKDVIASLLKQVAEFALESDEASQKSLLGLLRPVYGVYVEKKTHPSQQKLLDLLQRALQSLAKPFIVLDALDELSDDVKNSLLKSFSKLSASTLLTSRPLDLYRDLLPDAVHMNLDIQNEGDIKSFITYQLQDSPRLSRLFDNKQQIMEEVITRLITKSNGMFLIASLQMEALKHCNSMKKLREAIEKLPTGVSEMYDATLARINALDDYDASLAKRALVWLAYQSRPLKFNELQHALAISAVEEIFDEEDITPEDMIIAVCCGLIIIDGQSQIVRLIHYTAHDFIKANVSNILVFAPETFITHSCLIYIVESGFISKALSAFGKLGGNDGAQLLQPDDEDFQFEGLEGIVNSDDEDSEDQNPEDERLESIPNSEDEGPEDEDPEDEDSELKDMHHLLTFLRVQYTKWPFLRYAHKHWGSHANQMSKVEGFSDFLSKFLQQHQQYPYFDIKNGVWDIFEPVHIAASYGFLGIWPIPPHSCNTQTKKLYQPLTLAVMQGHDDVVKSLLFTDGIDVNGQNKDGDTALILAVQQNLKSIVKMLLSVPQIDVNMRNQIGNTALATAIMEGHEDIAKSLLSIDGIDLDTSNDHDDGPIIQLAIQLGLKDMVEMLISEGGIDLNARYEGSITLLMMIVEIASASEEFEEDMVKKLLSRDGIDFNAQDEDGFTVLMQAAFNGIPKMVEILLSRDGIDIHVQNEKGQTALAIALEQGHTAVVELLHSAQAHIDLPNEVVSIDEEYNLEDINNPPLSIPRDNIDLQSKRRSDIEFIAAYEEAAMEAYGEAAGESLPPSPELGNALDANDHAALKAAVEEGHEGNVELLLMKDGITLDFTDENSKTLLILAATQGHVSIVRLLLMKGEVDINARDNDGNTALIVAAGKGHKEVVKSLLSVDGVDVEAKNKDGDTARIRAADEGHRAIVRLLFAHLN